MSCRTFRPLRVRHRENYLQFMKHGYRSGGTLLPVSKFRYCFASFSKITPPKTAWTRRDRYTFFRTDEVQTSKQPFTMFCTIKNREILHNTARYYFSYILNNYISIITFFFFKTHFVIFTSLFLIVGNNWQIIYWLTTIFKKRKSIIDGGDITPTSPPCTRHLNTVRYNISGSDLFRFVRDLLLIFFTNAFFQMHNIVSKFQDSTLATSISK